MGRVAEPMVAPAAVDATTPAKTSARLSVRTLEHDLAGLFKHREGEAACLPEFPHDLP